MPPPLLARARPIFIPASTPSVRASLGEFLHLGLGVFAVVVTLDRVADVGPGDALALHDALQGSERVAALAAAGAQHAQELRNPFFVWTKIGHGDAPSSRIDQNGISSSMSLLRGVAALLGGNGLLAGALPFCASEFFAGEMARTFTVSFSSGGSLFQSL